MVGVGPELSFAKFIATHNCLFGVPAIRQVNLSNCRFVASPIVLITDACTSHTIEAIPILGVDNDPFGAPRIVPINAGNCISGASPITAS